MRARHLEAAGADGNENGQNMRLYHIEPKLRISFKNSHYSKRWWCKDELRQNLRQQCARHLEAAGADGSENGQAMQHWAKYEAVSQRTKVESFIQKKLSNFDYIGFKQIIIQPKHFCPQCSCGSSTFCLKAHAGFFKLLMKGNFDPYLLWPFDWK